MSETPDFRELVDEEGTPEELERLRRVHDMLVAAGPPPELSAALRAAPPTRSRVLPFLPRRKLETALAAAAAAAALAFGVGYLVGSSGGGFPTKFSKPMHGVGQAAAAEATIRIGKLDEQGNWPLLMTVRGLRPLPAGGYYVLWLTRKGEPAASCGTFVAAGASTKVRLNAPYRLKEYDGWIVTARRPGVPDTHQVLMTT